MNRSCATLTRNFGPRPNPPDHLTGWERHHDLVIRHGMRVAQLTYQLAWRYGLVESDARQVAEAAYLHDLGKIQLPDETLFGSTDLSSTARLIVESHTTIGFRLLRRFGAEHQLDLGIAALVSLHHHECWDGSGYPLGLAGNAIPFAAQLVAVVDVFDALVSGRSYKAPWPARVALDKLQEGSGRSFNPDLVELFVDMMTGESGEATPMGLYDKVGLDLVARRAFMYAWLSRNFAS